ncbi:MAG: cytochrome bc complex cytochrome b subunit [Fidelibacterota bacterium]|nr:MAG: cytochrome bc complex cytochrome b subunit [Candidatus Neomarinimicrobiota bacterium]
MSKISQWFEERYHLAPVVDFLRKKQVPLHRGWYWSYLGGVTLFLFAIQVVTGILLLMYYKPSATEAYESIRFIMSQVAFGWLIRSIHSWSANFMVLAAFLHMFSVFFQRAYGRPRELTWVTGAILLGLSLFFGFSGYLLPWNELAFFATKVGTEIVGAVPFVGKALMILLRGGEEVTGATLPRFFGIHVAVLPAMFTVFLGAHLIFIQVQGMHEPRAWAQQAPEKRRYMPFFPHFMLRDALLWLIVLNIVAIFAVFFPWELGAKADLFAPAPADIKPEWYFMFMFETLKLIPAHIWIFEGEVVGILGFMLGFLVWMLVPFIDRKDDENRYRLLKRIGAVVVIYIAAMTAWGYIQ